MYHLCSLHYLQESFPFLNLGCALAKDCLDVILLLSFQISLGSEAQKIESEILWKLLWWWSTQSGVTISLVLHCWCKKSKTLHYGKVAKKWFEVVNFEKYFSTDVQQKFDFFEGRCINIQNFVIQMGLIFFVKINIVKFATTKKV